VSARPLFIWTGRKTKGLTRAGAGTNRSHPLREKRDGFGGGGEEKEVGEWREKGALVEKNQKINGGKKGNARIRINGD